MRLSADDGNLAFTKAAWWIAKGTILHESSTLHTSCSSKSAGNVLTIPATIWMPVSPGAKGGGEPSGLVIELRSPLFFCAFTLRGNALVGGPLSVTVWIFLRPKSSRPPFTTAWPHCL